MWQCSRLSKLVPRIDRLLDPIAKNVGAPSAHERRIQPGGSGHDQAAQVLTAKPRIDCVGSRITLEPRDLSSGRVAPRTARWWQRTFDPEDASSRERDLDEHGVRPQPCELARGAPRLGIVVAGQDVAPELAAQR